MRIFYVVFVKNEKYKILKMQGLKTIVRTQKKTITIIILKYFDDHQIQKEQHHHHLL
jgi:hypothetical protein